MQTILLIAGLVLLLAGGSWFAGAATVGIICLVLFGIITLFQFLAFRKASKIIRGAQRRTASGYKDPFDHPFFRR